MAVSGSMLVPVMRHCRNFFNVSVEHGDFDLIHGDIELTGRYRVGQFLALTGTYTINGVYEIIAKHDYVYTLAGIDKDERWHGVVYGLDIPPDFIQLCVDIDEYNNSDMAKPSKLESESVLGAHTWKRALKDGMPIQWQDLFKFRIQPYRLLFTPIRI